MCIGVMAAARACYAKRSCHKPQLRWTHRAPDKRYLNEGIGKNIHFKNQVEEASKTIESFPKLFSNYLKVAAAATVKGKTPFVHAQPAYWSTARFLAKDLNPSFQERHPYFSYLRPVADKDFQIERKEIEDRIEAFCQKNGRHGWTPGSWDIPPSRCDEHPSIRKFLISVNYALLSNVSRHESAFYFVFNACIRMRKQDDWTIIEEVGKRSLCMRGIQCTDEFSKILVNIFEKYSSLNTGNICVIAVPQEKLRNFAYDSKSFGIPTGEKIEKVVMDPMSYVSRLSGEEGGLQARVMVHKDTMTPASGIDVVCVNEDEEVDRYCIGLEMTPPEEVAEYAPFIIHKQTAVEENDRQVRKELRKMIKDLAQNILQKPGH